MTPWRCDRDGGTRGWGRGRLLRGASSTSLTARVEWEDAFNSEYAGWPFRFWGVRGGKFEVVAQPAQKANNEGYECEEAFEWLKGSVA